MESRKFDLNIIQIPTPCTQDWDTMRGDDRVRFCGVCKKSVYHLSAMSRSDAENLVASHEGRMCVRFYRRADGTVVTSDCSAIREAVHRGKRLLITSIAGLFAMITGLSMLNGCKRTACVAGEMLPMPTATHPVMPSTAPSK